MWLPNLLEMLLVLDLEFSLSNGVGFECVTMCI